MNAQSELATYPTFMLAIRDAKNAYLDSTQGSKLDLTWNAEAVYAHQQIERTMDQGSWSLVQATPPSIRDSLVEAGRIGLSLDPRKQLVFLIARWNELRQQLDCKLEIGYRGFIRLGTMGGLKSASCSLVYDTDAFEFQGPDQPVIHRSRCLSTDPAKRGEVTGGYAVARFTNGALVTTIMSREELDVIEADAVSQSQGHSAWQGPYRAEMQRKTILRRAFKDWESVISCEKWMQSHLIAAREALTQEAV